MKNKLNIRDVFVVVPLLILKVQEWSSSRLDQVCQWCVVLILLVLFGPFKSWTS